MTLADLPSLCPYWVSAGEPAVVAPRPERAEGTASVQCSTVCAFAQLRFSGKRWGLRLAPQKPFTVQPCSTGREGGSLSQNG